MSLDKFSVTTGADPSYNNWVDIDRLLQTMTHIAAAYKTNCPNTPDLFIAVGAKHGNACGAAVGVDRAEVLRKMIEGDPRAIFGGLVMTNFEIDEDLTPAFAGKKLDGIIAPACTAGAILALGRKEGKCRFIVNPALRWLDETTLDRASRFRYVRGGFLVQPNYTFIPNLSGSGVRKYGGVFAREEDDMLLAWAVGSTSNSNTITLVKDGQLIGNAVGQQDRVGAADLAVTRARRSGHNVSGAVAYSDSFFPFTDGPFTLITAGVRAILTSSGSVRDQEVIDIFRANKVALHMLPDQEARGFYGH